MSRPIALERWVLVGIVTWHLWAVLQLECPDLLPACLLPCWPLSPAQRRRAVLRPLGWG